ncbi:MAG TPA: Hsp70 family protein [Gemmataceae bacterium]|jgi:molecular chaperone DnaK (HSP70)|nr:Hsp70 family protein [Gemmataceae bacterium]
MPGRLAVDFGTSNTVVAVWDESLREGVPLHIPDYGRQIQYRRGKEGDEQISVVPSLIHYGQGSRRWLGQQVLSQSLYGSKRTFRWMKRYIADRSPVKVRVDGRDVSHRQAGRDFLSAILSGASAEAGVGHEEVAFTVPVEAFEHYEDWLTGVAEAAGMPRFRLIDEASAAALGYGAPIQPGDVYLIFDFGGGTLDLSVVLMEEDAGQATGRRCRVLGKAGADVGGATIDGLLFQEVLRQNGRGDADEDVRQVSRALLVACEDAKERLSFEERAEIRVAHPRGGPELAATVTQQRFEALLDDHQVFTQIDHTLRRALNEARERGYAEEQIKAVLMVGGSSLIPSVQHMVQRIFSRDRVMLKRPLDAIARGAAAFVAGVDFYDHIQHDYAIRYVDPDKGDYQYRPLVQRGTPYPTREPVARIVVKASHDGQAELGIAIFEMAERRRHGGGQPVELVFDPSGAARVHHVTPDEEDGRHLFWINEHNPTFLHADPPGRQGEPRFEVEFGIDANKRLLITARDLKTGRTLLRDQAVVKLT